MFRGINIKRNSSTCRLACHNIMNIQNILGVPKGEHRGAGFCVLVYQQNRLSALYFNQIKGIKRFLLYKAMSIEK